LKVAASFANAGVSWKGFSDVNLRLDGVQQQIGEIGQNLNNIKGLAQLTSATSILNLGVSVIGFAIIIQRLNEIEGQLKKSEQLLNKINRKIDLGFYAKFRAALDLAKNAFRMSKAENRRSSALAAINLFLEAEHIYTDYVDQELEQKSQITDEYLLTLSLAYIAEARCYLELGEFDTALGRYQEGSEKVRARIQKYIELLLTSNPAAYLDPQFKGQIDLRRLTRIYQWIDPALDENAVFELQRDNCFSWKKDQGIESGYKWANSLPPAIAASDEVKGSIFGNREELKQEAIKRLPSTMELMESMIETNHRFESYQTEIKAISQLGISFHDWMLLAPADETSPESSNLVYIIPKEPLAV
jgi:tetratricopeptide (TPR) repeat protein